MKNKSQEKRFGSRRLEKIRGGEDSGGRKPDILSEKEVKAEDPEPTWCRRPQYRRTSGPSATPPTSREGRLGDQADRLYTGARAGRTESAAQSRAQARELGVATALGRRGPRASAAQKTSGSPPTPSMSRQTHRRGGGAT